MSLQWFKIKNFRFKNKICKMQVQMLRKNFNSHHMEQLNFPSIKAKTIFLNRKQKKMKLFNCKKVRNKLKYSKMTMIAIKGKNNQNNF